MKKYINYAFGYAIAGMAAGVFFREFTKFNAFEGVTALGKVHTHLFMLGMVMMLLVAAFAAQTTLTSQKNWKVFMVTYNTGVSLASVMMVVRGVLQVLGTPLSTGLNAAISGISGIAHILIAVGIVLFFLMLRKSAK